MELIAIITDIHFGCRNDNQLFHNNLFDFLEGDFFPYLEENNIKHLFILGDTWDKRKIINFNTLFDVKKRFFDRLASLGIQVKMLIGNHDIYFKNTPVVNSVELLLGQYQNIEIIDPFKLIDFYGTQIGLISWITAENYYTTYKDCIEWIKTCPASILMGHFEINSFGEYESGLSPTIFNRYEMVISGHYHIPSTDGKIFYLGNPNQTNWNEYGVKRGFWVFNPKTLHLELIENKHNIYEKFYYVEEQINLSQFNFSSFKNKILKIYANVLELKNRKKYDLFIEGVAEYAYSFETIDTQYTNNDDYELDLDDLKEIDAFTVIQQYIDGIDNDNLDKKKVLMYFNKIYKQASEMTITK